MASGATGETTAEHVRRDHADFIARGARLTTEVSQLPLDATLEAMRVAHETGGSTVLDLACGTGDFVVELNKAGHTAVGIDLSYGMLAAGRDLRRLTQGDLLALPVADASVDAAVCGYALRNLVSLEPFFAELARVVRPGGRIALVDVSAPENPVMKWGFDLHFNKIVPKIGGLLGSDRNAYQYLPKSVAYLPPWPEMKAQLDAAGFVDVERKVFTGAHLFTATRGAA